MSEFVDIHVVRTLSEFLNLVDGTDSFTTPETVQIFERLLYQFNLAPTMEPVTLGSLMSYVCALWASDNLTLQQLGYLDLARNELEHISYRPRL